MIVTAKLQIYKSHLYWKHLQFRLSITLTSRIMKWTDKRFQFPIAFWRSVPIYRYVHWCQSHHFLCTNMLRISIVAVLINLNSGWCWHKFVKVMSIRRDVNELYITGTKANKVWWMLMNDLLVLFGACLLVQSNWQPIILHFLSRKTKFFHRAQQFIVIITINSFKNDFESTSFLWGRTFSG